MTLWLTKQEQIGNISDTSASENLSLETIRIKFLSFAMQLID